MGDEFTSGGFGRMHKSAVLAYDDCLCPVICIQSSENHAYMALDGGYTNSEPFCDILIRISFGHKLQYFAFTGAQTAVGGPLG